MRRIKRADIRFLSLCPKGANQMECIYKSEDNSVTFDTQIFELTKFEEKGELCAVVYAPEQRDSQGDIASAEVIKQMCYDAMKNGLEIDTKHDETGLSKEDVYIAESFIIQKGDPRFADQKTYDGRNVDVTGGWGVVLKIDNPELRKTYRDKWKGISMGGDAVMETEKEAKQSTAKAIGAAMSKAKSHQGEIEMDPKEFAAAMAEANKPLLDGIADLKKSLESKPADEGETKTEEDKKEETADAAPVFKGDFSDVEALNKHAEEVELYNLRKDADFSTPEGIRAYTDKVAKLKADKDESLKKQDQGNEEKNLRSNQGDKLQKTEAGEDAKTASSIAAIYNKQGKVG